MRVLMKSRPRSCYENQPLRLRWATIRRSAVRLGCAPGRTVPFGTSASYRFALIQGWAKAPGTARLQTTNSGRGRRLRAFAHPTPLDFNGDIIYDCGL